MSGVDLHRHDLHASLTRQCSWPGGRNTSPSRHVHGKLGGATVHSVRDAPFTDVTNRDILTILAASSTEWRRKTWSILFSFCTSCI